MNGYTRFQKRISGPLLDRFDIHIEVPRVNYEKLTADRLGETSDTVRSRVIAADQNKNARSISIDRALLR